MGSRSADNICPVCLSSRVSPFFGISQVPIHCNILWPSRESALGAPKGAIQLALCADCGHIFNLVFDPNLTGYDEDYENSLHFSPRFQVYSRSLAESLVSRYDLHNKDLIEIGCGNGDFLITLCELGKNRGVGFDPGYTPERSRTQPGEQITFIQDYYTERYAHYRADFLCCRHVLEHLHHPLDFLHNIRRTIGVRSDSVVFFEVPNVMFMLRDLSVWDIIYEHYSYFSNSSLERLFTLSGFEVCNLTETFEGQYLCVEALPGNKTPSSKARHRKDLDEVKRLASVFAEDYRRKVEFWASELGKVSSEGKKAVVWGGGSKGVTFLNTLATRDQIHYVVDINPHKQGKYIAGTGQKIVSPELLRSFRPDYIILMNAIYYDEVSQLAKGMNLPAKVLLT